ncbi:MAG: TolC family protein [Sulfuriferula sp.]
MKDRSALQRRITLSLLILAPWLPGLSHSAKAETLNFAQCVSTALQQNFDLTVSREQVDQAEAGLGQAQGKRLPQLTASLNAIGTNDALSAFGLRLSQRNANFNDFGAGQFNPGNPGALTVAPNNLNNPGFVKNFNPRLELQIPVYTGGMISGGIKQAQAYIQAAQNGDQAARQQVIFDVLRAYQGVYATRAYLSVTRQSETAAESQVQMMQKLVKSGVIVKSDLLSAQVHLQDVRVQRTQAENAVANALDQLHLLLGLPLTEPLDIGAPVEVKPVLTPTETLKQTAVANNPGINALRHQLEARQAGVDIAKALYQPQVGLMLRQDWNDPQLGFGASSYTIGGSVTWIAFDGGITKASVERARSAQNETAAKLAQSEANIAFQVADAKRKASEAEQRLSVRQLALEQAEEAASLVDKRYASGVATITEQLGAQAQLDKARADIVTAQYDLTIQRASLKLALGQLGLDSL